jgi:CDP-diacylglycerol--serine O-phosphatidyltransferase
MIDDPNRPEWKKNFFVGMAAPMGALSALLPLYLSFLGVPIRESGVALVVLVYAVGIALLMVSTVPTYSGKTMGKYVPRQWVLPIFVLSVAAFGLLVSFPFEMLALGTILFLLTIPIGVMRYRRLDRAHVQQPAEDRPPAAAEPPLDA